MTEPLETEARRRIYAELKKRPGAHFSQVQRNLDMATGTLQYHLRYLERKGLIDVRDDGRYTRYFPSLDIDRRWKSALGLLRQPTPRAIVLDLLEHGTSRLSDISERTDTPASTLSFHLKKLIEADVVAKEGRGVYGLTDPDAMVQILAEYRAGFLDAAVDRIVRLFTGVGREPASEEEPDGDERDEGVASTSGTSDRAASSDAGGPTWNQPKEEARGFCIWARWLGPRARWRAVL